MPDFSLLSLIILSLSKVEYIFTGANKRDKKGSKEKKSNKKYQSK